MKTFLFVVVVVVDAVVVVVVVGDCVVNLLSFSSSPPLLHVAPNQPSPQVQLPETGSQIAPLEHWHANEQFGPYVPVLHTLSHRGPVCPGGQAHSPVSASHGILESPQSQVSKQFGPNLPAGHASSQFGPVHPDLHKHRPVSPSQRTKFKHSQVLLQPMP